MSEAKSAIGQCLCRAVTVRVDTIEPHVGACHCAICRKWGGGPLMAVECSGDSISISGDISLFESSEWAERAFCPTCGTHLFYRLKEQGMYALPAALLDIEGQLDFDHQIFVDEKPAYYHFGNVTRMMTGAEVFAQFDAT